MHASTETRRKPSFVLAMPDGLWEKYFEFEREGYS